MTSEGWAVIRWNGTEEGMMLGELKGPFLTEEAAIEFARKTVLEPTSSHGILWERSSVVPIGVPTVMIWEEDDNGEL